MLDLAQLSITGLFKALTDVEQAIHACDPTFTPAGDGAAVNPRLIELATQERQICDELAGRRLLIREQLQARLAELTEAPLG